MSPAYCSCGAGPFDDPAAAGEHESECTGTIEMNAETETMTDENSTTTAEEQSIKNELAMIMPGSDPLANLLTKRTGLNEYQVLSARNGSVTLHTVALSQPSCTCDDWQFNTEEGSREICAHFAAAFIDAQDVDNGDMLMAEMGSMMNAAVELREAAQQAEDVFQGATVEARAQQADAAAASAQSQPADTGPDPEQLVDDLREALEYNGFEIESLGVSGGDIAFSLRHQNFDRLKEVTSECEMVGYDGDNNVLETTQVEQYIEEVL